MPTATPVATLAVDSLIDELDALRSDQIDRITALQAATGSRLAEARSQAMDAMAVTDRLEWFGSATQRLAAACIIREVPQPVRAAAYAALVALVANDLIPPATFRALYEAWGTGLAGGDGSPAIHRDEEILLHIE